ncbi:MAG: hypothetical protein H0X16_11575, partial [Chloroflexi bacterium]|nr:hypothetical protein [Chloroflexota bacterium]
MPVPPTEPPDRNLPSQELRTALAKTADEINGESVEEALVVLRGLLDHSLQATVALPAAQTLTGEGIASAGGTVAINPRQQLYSLEGVDSART